MPSNPRFRLHCLLLVYTVLLAACAPAGRFVFQEHGEARPARLQVFAAASLKDAFDALAPEFAAQNGGAQIVYNLGGSQQLTQQLAGGAPADLFASANARQMQAAVDAGRVAPNASRIFAHNRLVVVYPADNPAQIDDLADLARPGLKLVLAAPQVPAGQYALEFLDKAAAAPGMPPDYRAAVLANAVSYEENVRSVLNKVTLGEADAGIVYASDVAGDATGRVGTLEIPAALNVAAEYPVAPVLDAEQPELARRFVELLLSPQGRAVLEQHGFSTP